MGVYEGRGQLNKALRELVMRWHDAKMVWDDAVSREFEKDFVGPLELTLRQAMGAMDHMAAVLQQAKRDCE